MITNISLKNFYGFEQFVYDDVARITLLVGANDAGKTGLLKMTYAVARSLVEMEREEKMGPTLARNFKEVLSAKILGTFMPQRHGLGELVKFNAHEKLSAKFSFKGDDRFDPNFDFTKDATKQINGDFSYRKIATDLNVLFLPAKEVLSLFNAIEYTREKGVLDFDDTYYDLVRSLRIATKKGKIALEHARANKTLEELFEGKIVQNFSPGTSQQFMFKKGNHQISISQTAEGIKKIGILTTLINNRELGKNTILFLDEPETALHPLAQRQFVKILYNLTKIPGVQIFMATHSYFFINEFYALVKNEQEKEAVTVNCISLEKSPEKDKTIEFTISNLKDGMPENGILEVAYQQFNDMVDIELR